MRRVRAGASQGALRRHDLRRGPLVPRLPALRRIGIVLQVTHPFIFTRFLRFGGRESDKSGIDQGIPLYLLRASLGRVEAWIKDS